MHALCPGLRMGHCERHYVVFLPHDTAAALVVAMLHERMKLMVRLRARLNARALSNFICGKYNGRVVV